MKEKQVLLFDMYARGILYHILLVILIKRNMKG